MSTTLTPQAAAEAADELWQRIRDLVAAIPDDRWHAPTPCELWDVHALVAHLAGTGGAFFGVEQPAPPDGWRAPEGMSPLDAAVEAGVAARADRTRDELEAELAVAHRAHVDALRGVPDLDGAVQGPVGPTDHRGLFEVRMFDMWHHLWDLHRGADLSFDVDDRTEGARACHAYVAGRTPWLFGKRAGAPDGAAVRLRLGPPLSLDGSVVVDGRARWTDEPAADVVEGPPAAFSLLMTGRISRDEAADLGLRADGREAERLLDARMFG